ncbi:MAG TPA: tetratricopeptide repeat protein [Patescibacteria group bacterium]|nr:tetratricopeptide repeat protein [Patescibacteria group bacterium]
MKKKIFSVILMIWLFSGVLAAEAGSDIFAKAKMLIFDKQWAAALKQLDEVIGKHADSRYYAAALFYRGKCQEELGAKKQALESYEKFVKTSPSSNLAEEAQISMIDLAAGLYRAGEKNYLQKMLRLLDHENKVVSYYAAFKLSYLADRKNAARALPVLQTILDKEKDEELRDRAKIAVMRIDPARLKGMDRQNKDLTERLLKIRIYNKKSSQEEFSLNIPLALADLALRSLGAEKKRALQKEGYNLDRILNQLIVKGMKIDIKDEDSVIQIWVE